MTLFMFLRRGYNGGCMENGKSLGKMDATSFSFDSSLGFFC